MHTLMAGGIAKIWQGWEDMRELVDQRSSALFENCCQCAWSAVEGWGNTDVMSVAWLECRLYMGACEMLNLVLNICTTFSRTTKIGALSLPSILHLVTHLYAHKDFSLQILQSRTKQLSKEFQIPTFHTHWSSCTRWHLPSSPPPGSVWFSPPSVPASSYCAPPRWRVLALCAGGAAWAETGCLCGALAWPELCCWCQPETGDCP